MIPTKTSEKVNVVVNGRTVERTVYLVKGTRCYSKRDSTTHKTKYVPIGKTKQVGGNLYHENNAWQTPTTHQVKQQPTSILNDFPKIEAEEKAKQNKGMHVQEKRWYKSEENAALRTKELQKKELERRIMQKAGMLAFSTKHS